MLAIVLAGCTGGADRSAAPRVYDLGIEPVAVRLEGLRVLAVRAPAPFDTSDMLYRLAFRDPAELMAFTQSRWAANPATLLQRRFTQAAGGAAGRCGIEFELSELSQVFSSPQASALVLEGHVQIVAGSSRIAGRGFRIREEDAGGNAASGARALARAVDGLINELSGWTAQIAACRQG